MKTLHFLTSVGLLAIAGSAQALDYFSIGPVGGPSPGDPGPASFETLAVTFDAPSAPWVTETNNVSHSLLIYQGSTLDVAAAPALDKTKYEAIAPRQSALFSFGNQTHHINTISFYMGSIDNYNSVQIVDAHGRILETLGGTVWPGYNGDWFGAATNRRVYITNLPSDFYGILFKSSWIAEEYDDIAVSPAIFCSGSITDGGVYPSVPMPCSVPEPGAWMLMLSGLGLAGAALRSRAARASA